DHTGYEKTRHYGTSTKTWQMDVAILLEEVERPWADVSMKLKFLKARERTPENRPDFEPVIITLERGQWLGEKIESATEGSKAAAPPPKPKSPPPLAVKFYDALGDACIDGKISLHSAGHPAVTQAEWERQLVRLALVDPDKAHSMRTLISKCRRELLA